MYAVLGNILPSSQHFLTTSNIPKFSSIIKILNTNFCIPNFWQETPLVRAYSPVTLLFLRLMLKGSFLYNLLRAYSTVNDPRLP